MVLHKGRHSRNFQNEQATSDLIQQFVMRASDADAAQILYPILEADRHPHEVWQLYPGANQ
jgi:hypothetical protein